MKVSPTTQTSYLIVVQSKVSIVDLQYVFLIHSVVLLCMRICTTHRASAQQLQPVSLKLQIILYFKLADLTMTLSDHQQDCQDTQINLNNSQLQTNQSIECSIVFQSMAKHLLFTMIVK